MRSFQIHCGGGKSVEDSMTALWTETTFPTILSKYELKDIFNTDELGLFYQCLQDKTFKLGSENCSGGKKNNIRLTGMAAANSLGEKLEMFVIGQAASPRCFKHIKSLPCPYRNEKKSWMAGEFFEKWVKGLDRGFRVKDRKIALLIDNCPAHRTIEGLTNIHNLFTTK